MDKIEIIRSNKGGMKLIHREYMYTVHKRRQGGGIRWRCTQRSLHCKGSISTGNGGPKINMAHNHMPDSNAVAVARYKQLEELGIGSSYYDDFKADSLVEPLQKSKIASNVAQPKPVTSAQKYPIAPKIVKAAAPVKHEFKEAEPHNEKSEQPDEVCLRWNSHHSNMKCSFPSLLEKEQYVDVTLCADGQTIKCHKLILSSCSSYFDEILSTITPTQHPVIFLKNTPFWILKSLIDFMYVGEVHIEQARLQEILEVAELLKIKGLTGKSNSNECKDEPNSPYPGGKTAPKETPAPKNLPRGSIQMVDPLHLMKPQYFDNQSSLVTSGHSLREGDPHLPPKRSKPSESEDDQEWLPKKYVSPKKKLKRKSQDSLETTPAPSPIILRKGTKSRPIVKAPKYYHMEYDHESNTTKPVLKDENPDHNTPDVPEKDAADTPEVDNFDVANVKPEPIDVLDIEENDVGFDQMYLNSGTINFAEATMNDNFGEQQEIGDHLVDTGCDKSDKTSDDVSGEKQTDENASRTKDNNLKGLLRINPKLQMQINSNSKDDEIINN